MTYNGKQTEEIKKFFLEEIHALNRMTKEEHARGDSNIAPLIKRAVMYNAVLSMIEQQEKPKFDFFSGGEVDE